MSYTVKSSERLRKSASDSETKALLYLMNFHSDSEEIYYFVVDFFNDLTGINRMSTKLWDLQSKGARNSSPKAVGRELVTLYKNYVSDFIFNGYILFLGGVSSSVRIDSSLTVFDYTNLKDTALVLLKKGLIEECETKTYIDNDDIDDDLIDNFIKEIMFVIDDKQPCEYVKSIVKVHSGIMPSDEILTGIFNEIRDQQSLKKNTVVENITIETTDQALNYYRHLTSSEIKLLVLGRIINRNPFDKGCPIPFISIYNDFPEEKRAEALDDCKLALSRALFNKNNADNFWTLFAEVHQLIVENPIADINEIFRLLSNDTKDRVTDFEVLSLKYFISTVKEGFNV